MYKMNLFMLKEIANELANPSFEDNQDLIKEWSMVWIFDTEHDVVTCDKCTKNESNIFFAIDNEECDF